MGTASEGEMTFLIITRKLNAPGTKIEWLSECRAADQKEGKIPPTNWSEENDFQMPRENPSASKSEI